MIDKIKDKYSFKEIIKLQKQPLQKKIKFAVKVLKEADKLSQHNIALAFSGGKDSQVVADLIERFVPELHNRIYCLFGNTTCEFPESLKFAREYGKVHYGERFRESKPLPLEYQELRYDFARALVSQIEKEGCLSEILKDDGKLSGQKALIDAAIKRGYELNESNCFFPGHSMNFTYCLEQYGMPLMGKAASKLDAHRINIECFLKYSKSESENEKLQEYYDVLKECKFSQHCCTLLKKKPSEELQKNLGVDVIIKGLMADESHTRMINVATRGCIFASRRAHITDGNFYHVSPIAMWTDRDIWNYIEFFKLEYSPLYDITYENADGNTRHITRNGCMFCGTDLMFRDNHLSVLRQTHPKAYDICMEKFGYRKALNILFRRYKKQTIYEAMNKQGKISRMLFSVGDMPAIRRVLPCAYDDIGDMMNLEGTGLEHEYDDEIEILNDEGKENPQSKKVQMIFDFSGNKSTKHTKYTKGYKKGR